MSLLLECPNCGKRNVGEFTFRGEYKPRPHSSAPFPEWVKYVYFHQNQMGRSTEWWFHRAGCQRWFLVSRDNTNSPDHRSFWFEDRNPQDQDPPISD